MEKYELSFRTKTTYQEDCRVKITIEIKSRTNLKDWDTLETIPERECLSICGDLYLKGKRNPQACGQIYDDFMCITPAQCHLVNFWRKYHLNDLKAGTKAQTLWAEEYTKNKHYDYKEVCEYLKEHEMFDDRGYKYGHGWLSREFPKDELYKIIEELKKEG